MNLVDWQAVWEEFDDWSANAQRQHNCNCDSCTVADKGIDWSDWEVQKQVIEEKVESLFLFDIPALIKKEMAK